MSGHPIGKRRYEVCEISDFTCCLDFFIGNVLVNTQDNVLSECAFVQRDILTVESKELASASKTPGSVTLPNHSQETSVVSQINV